MQVPSRISAVELTDKRLDAEYYEKSYRINARLISQFGRTTNLENIRSAKAPIRRGIDMPKFVELSDAPVIVTISAFEEPNVNFSKLQKIDIQQHSRFKGSHLKPGDLLIAMGGYAGKSAICPSDTPLANIGRHTARVVIDPQKANKYYIWSFISSSIGKLQFGREITGSVQAGINIEDLREILISMPALEVQKYIGDKVRQAERLRDRSRELGKIVDRQLIEAGILVATEFSRTSRISSTLMFNRLDHLHYRTDLLINYQAIQKYPTAKLGNKKYFDNLYDGDHGNPVYGNGPTYIRASEINGHRLNESESACLDKKYAESISKTRWAHEGDIVFSIVGTLGLIAVLRSGQKGIMSRGVAKITSLLLPTYYVKAFMRTSAFGKELLRQSVGTVQRGIYLEALGNIPIPIIEDSVMDSIARMEEESDTSAYLSEWLTNTAKFLVEALIEGKVSEADLKAAQESLEKGDITLDQEILARLTRKGIDRPNEPPLFPDLDALYAALGSLDVTETTEKSNSLKSQASNVYHLHRPSLDLASEADETAYQITAEVPE
jgi:type I restriction enzyme, S subunit